MKQICIGILAHVDAGKTTLSEALLYRAGAIRRLGRVDHQDAFLDTDAMERQRGITIFSKQAVLELGETRVTLLDTPGHVDFSAEMERTLQVLDCAVLVISGTDGVQGHTRTLWDLLERYQVPTFLFINKMDLAGADRTALLAHLKNKLSGGCVDFGDPDTLWEEAAVCDEAALEQYLETGELPEDMISRLIGERKLFPCYFGSALKVEGVDALLAGVERYAPQPAYPAEFGAKVFKITRDAQGARLTHMKITGGALHTKELLTGREGDTVWQEKADQLRLYSGSKFHPVDTAEAGAVVAVTHGDKLLMTRYQGRAYKGYALIAGFTEIGETAEDTVRREVMEEVGLRVKDIRYYGSQPWGMDSNLLMGFYARLDGEAEIHMDRQELSQAGWYRRDEISLRPDGYSLTNHMIQAFLRGDWQ